MDDGSQPILFHWKEHPHHYYGHIVRRCLFGAAIVMLVSLPFVKDAVPVPPIVSVSAIIALSLFAGFTNSKQRGMMVVDLIISLAGAIVFSYYSIFSNGTGGLLFVVNQINAVLFLVALYFSTKTLKNFFVYKRRVAYSENGREKEDRPHERSDRDISPDETRRKRFLDKDTD